MTTYIIYGDANDAFIRSTSTSYAAARTGSNLIVDNTNPTVTKIGQNIGGSTFYVYESFFSFDTSVIADTEEIVDVNLKVHSGWEGNPQTQIWGARFFPSNWTAPLTTAAWVNPATLQEFSGYWANIDHLTTWTPFRDRYTGSDALVANISKTAPTKFMAVSNRTIGGYQNSGTEEIWVSTAETGNKPALIVYTTTLTTMNVVGRASVSLSDGTAVSIRSNGAASPTLTVGYQTLTGTWTSLGTLHANFSKTIDGQNSIAMTTDTAGNFFIFGTMTGTSGVVVGQAFKRTGPTTWTAMTPLTQPAPTGNGSTIRSLAATYMLGGQDSTDTPTIWLLISRGASGIDPSFSYHTDGAGWSQDIKANPATLLAGTGTLLFPTSANTYGVTGNVSHTATGLPVFVDAVEIGPNLNAVYVQRGKFGNTVVGGISTIGVYRNDGVVKFNDSIYEPTGASKLVAVSANMFAHIFDANGEKLIVRFYNAQCQRLGETYLAASNFTGGSIGDKFSAVFDKTANLVRVYFMNSASGINMSRFDVSPTTFNGTVAANVTTTYGAAATVSSALRLPSNGLVDERKVLVEGSNRTGAGVLSTVSFASTAGNIAPAAPVQTVHANYDAAQASPFIWKFSDTNPKDTQRAYEFEVSRVSDSVVALTSGKVVSSVESHTVAANALTNGVNYRWRVRTYDQVDSVGTWSGYSTFTTAATGTVVITSPSVDNPSPMETDDYNVQWTYTNTNAATQAQRRVRVIRTSDGAVVSDTTMQVSTTTNYLVTGMESGKEYRVEVSLINSSSVASPVVSRLITPNYSEPMIPTTEITAFDSYIQILVVNPTPTGDRPEVVVNDIYRRRTKAGSIDADFVRIASIDRSAVYRDYAVKSGVTYDYRVIGRTTL